MTTFDDIRRRIQQDRGYSAARDYEEAYERDGHWKYDRVYSRDDAADGADYPSDRHAREAYSRLKEEL